MILARYSAETICHIVEGTTNTGDNKCSVRIMVVNNATEQQVEARPCNQFTNFAFDSTSGGTETVLAQESHSMDCSVVVGRGTYTMKAQWTVTHTDVRFRVDDWSLTDEKGQSHHLTSCAIRRAPAGARQSLAQGVRDLPRRREDRTGQTRAGILPEA